MYIYINIGFCHKRQRKKYESHKAPKIVSYTVKRHYINIYIYVVVPPFGEKFYFFHSKVSSEILPWGGYGEWSIFEFNILFKLIYIFELQWNYEDNARKCKC